MIRILFLFMTLVLNLLLVACGSGNPVKAVCRFQTNRVDSLYPLHKAVIKLHSIESGKYSPKRVVWRNPIG